MASISNQELKPTFFDKGRYIHKCEITKIDDWDSIFKHILGVPPAIYDTAQLIYDKEFSGHRSRYPDIMYIPLACSYQNFRRCILHIETTEMDQHFIPVEVTYHLNHIVAKGIEQVFFNSKDEKQGSSVTFITDNEIIYYYTVSNEDCIQRIKRLINETYNFEDVVDVIPLSNFFPDPNRVAYAKSNIIYCDPDIDPIGFKESNLMWKEIVYPKLSKEAYLQFISNQINIHRCERVKWQSKNPELCNPIVLPSLSCESSDAKCMSFEKQNHNKRINLANNNIQILWNYLNGEERNFILLQLMFQ